MKTLNQILVLLLFILTRVDALPRIVHPRVIPRAELSRDRRSAASNLEFVSLSEWVLKTTPNEHLVFSPKFRIEHPNGSYEPIDSCETREGTIQNREADSRVLLTRCKDDFFGLVSLENRTYLVEPLVVSNSSTHEHFLYEADFSRTRRHAAATSTVYETNNRRYFNLTGDTFEQESYEGSLKHMLNNLGRSSVLDGSKKQSTEDEGSMGYFLDRSWFRDKLPTRKTMNKYSPPKWLELAIVADYSVIDFHGSRVQQYLLALLNIVSAIYRDPSLDSNMQLVVVRMILYPDKKDGMVQHGNARRSLENVNRWNRKLLNAEASNDTGYDVAVWLTRLDIGGPSGYAPVSGVCDPARSCALNRDEGLTSAFIIAHEVAHILGLSHDGDKNSGNSCAREAARGSIMAPMVAATFHNFHWSTCSRKEFHRKAKHWTCLSNRPRRAEEPPDELLLRVAVANANANEIFSMDEQCRMEFGEGYSRCRSAESSDMCGHLWCGRANNASLQLPCKTKKGPPLEGTLCDQNKWCVNGMCEPISQSRRKPPPLEGTWGSWGAWTECSRSCGPGAVQYRTRKCATGTNCRGDSKEFRLCKLPDCKERVDRRSQQCTRFFEDRGSLRDRDPYDTNNNTWLPYEPFEPAPHCQLVCRRKETGEIFHTGLDLEDGTTCSYDGPDICIDGSCRSMGCDGVAGSDKQEDACGQCGGSNSTCEIVAGKFQRKLRRGTTRLAVIPKSARNIKVVVTILLADAVPHEGNMKILVRDGQKRRHEISEFDAADGRAPVMIIEGAAFRIERLEEKYVLWSRGPVSSEIVVSLIAAREVIRGGASIATSWQCVLARSELERFRSRYQWAPGGPPGPCSASCGGGFRRRTLLCKDETTGETVARKKCQLLPKPTRLREIEKCNTGSCDYTWIPGMWERCTQSPTKTTSTTTSDCQGMQQRRLYCVRSSFSERQLTKDNELRVYRNTVAPVKCRDLGQPVTERECIRTTCAGTWVYSDWSPCSQSCGRGVQTRRALCIPGLPDTSCNNLTKIPDEIRLCKAVKSPECIDDEFSCRKDRAAFCQAARRDLTTKCKNPIFRNRCCYTCREK